MPPASTARSMPAGLSAGDRPGIEKQQFHVEDQKGDRHQVKPHVEPAARVVNRIHAALVRHPLHRPVAARPHQHPDDQHAHRDGQGHSSCQENGYHDIRVNPAPVTIILGKNRDFVNLVTSPDKEKPDELVEYTGIVVVTPVGVKQGLPRPRGKISRGRTVASRRGESRAAAVGDAASRAATQR